MGRVGWPNEVRTHRRRRRVPWLALVLAAWASVVAVGALRREPTGSTGDDRDGAVGACGDLVVERLGGPASSAHPLLDDADVTDLASHTYRVVAAVEYTDTDGALVSTTFDCTVHDDGDAEAGWTVDELTIAE